MELYSFPFVTSLLHITQCFQDSSMLQHMLEHPSTLRLNTILLYVYTTLSSSINFSFDTWMDSTMLLWVMLLWAWAYKYLFKILLLIPLSIPWSGTLGSQSNSIFNFWVNQYTVFHSSYTTLYSHKQWTSVPISPHHCQRLLNYVLFCF